MRNKIMTLSLIIFIIIFFLFVPNCFATDGEEIIEFKDQCVKEYFINETYTHEEYDDYGNVTNQTLIQMDENLDGEISVAEMEKIETIYLSEENTVTDYSFFKYCKNLRKLQICYQELEDISFLSNLTSLEDVMLIENNISDISSLENLTNLKKLYLSSNNISDASVVSNLINLTVLDISDNKLIAIPDLSKILAFNDAEAYEKLGEYNISVNFSSNQITDISGLENTTLKNIFLYNNKVSDLSSLATMTNLTSLDVSYNEINEVSNLPTTLTHLTISNNQISDISFLKKLTKLKYLSANNNQILDISSLSELINLQSIDLNNNKIKELAISDFEELSSLSCRNNEIEKVTLKNLPKVYYLSLSNNNISDLSNISGLDKIDYMDLSTNPISNISAISSIFARRIYLVDTLVNPYDEATFHIMCTWNENGTEYLLGDCSQFLPSNEEKFTTKEIEEVAVGDEIVTVMPTEKKTTVEEIITESNFPVIDTYTIKVLDASGNEKSSDAKVGSRNVIQITDEEGTVLAEYMVVVPGDISGDGEIRIYDAFQILKDVLVSFGAELDSIDYMIRDFNNDGNVRIYDAFQYLKEAILG